MCDCDFSTKEYLDAVMILHPIGPDSLMVLLGDYSYVDRRDENFLVLGNLRHDSKVAIDSDSVFEIADDNEIIDTPVLPVATYLVDHPEDVVVIKADIKENLLVWAAIKRTEKGSL